MNLFFADKRMGQIKTAADKGALVLLPVGILEEHGPHLPINTDNIIAHDISCLVAKKLSSEIPTWVLPTIWAGYHGKHLAKMPGSVKVRQESLFNYVYDVCESLVLGGFRKIVLVNAHGQNPAILELVCRKLADEYGVNMLLTYPMSLIGKEGRQIKSSPEGGAGGHACEVETSLVLSLREDLVDMSQVPEGDSCTYKSKFVAGDLFPDHEVVKFGYWSTFALQGTKSGVLGEPKFGSKEKGDLFVTLIVNNYVELLREFYAHEDRLIGTNYE